MSAGRLSTSDDGAVVRRARVQIPSWGLWWADVDVQSELALERGDAVTLTIDDVALVGTVVDGGAAFGRAAYRIVAGTGGWSTLVSAAAYRDDVGVAVASVVRDVASLVGETVGTLPTTRLATHYARSAGHASRVLHDVAPRAWYVDFDGVTQLGVRATTVYDGRATRVAVTPGAAYVDLATDDLAALVPGVIVDGAEPATDVEIRLDERRTVARVYAGPRSSRDLDALRRMFDAIDPLRAYRAAYEFRVVSLGGGRTLNLQPVRSSSGLPDLERVPVRLSPGVRANDLLGSLVTVLFLDGDPSRPRAFTGDDADAPGWAPDAIGIDVGASGTIDIGASASLTTLGPSPQLGVARVGDAVIAGPWAGTITAASSTVKAGA